MDNTREKLIELVFSSLCKHVHKSCKLAENIADDLIADGVTVQEWIPVSEPPKEKGVYLISITHWLDGKPVTREAKWNGADWLSCYRKEEITPRVTHWMPMPEPPKGE